jgi:hypothetical protein
VSVPFDCRTAIALGGATFDPLALSEYCRSPMGEGGARRRTLNLWNLVNPEAPDAEV